MIRQIEVTVEPSTTAINPNITEIKIGQGLLSRVVVRPAPGPNWEVYFRLMHMDNSIVPDIKGEWIPLEKDALIFTPNFNDWKGVLRLNVELCSPEAKYKHTIQVEIEIEEKPSIVDTLHEFIQKGL
jgi:hypothetical protein